MSARHELEALLVSEHPVTRGQAIDAYRAEVLRETAEDLRVALARTVVGQSGDLDIVLNRLVDMADQAESGGAA